MMADQNMNRREMLAGSITSLAVACLPSGYVTSAEERDRRDPMDLAGLVMSGEVHGNSAVVWTRAKQQSRVTFEYSRFSDFRDRNLVDGSIARPVNDFTSRAKITGLLPGEQIFFRAHSKDAEFVSAVGSFRAAPDKTRDISFLWSGDLCGQGAGIDASFSGLQIFRSMLSQDADFFINSGDFIYADHVVQAEVVGVDGTKIRQLVTEEKSVVAESLDQFRGNYRYNFHDPALREFFQRTPVFLQWDDHETLNNWYPGGMTSDERYKERSHDVLAARAKQAFLEYSPIQPGVAGDFYQKFSYGPLLDVFRIDLRSYRAANSANRQVEEGPASAFMGQQQVAWLKAALLASKATWKVIASDMPLGLVIPDGTEHYEGLANGEPGLPLGREIELAGLLRFIKAMNIENVIWLTADVHYAAAHQYHPERAAFKDFSPFWEFVAGPLHAGTFGPNKLDPTFGPKVDYCSVPEGIAQNRPPSEGRQYYGKVDIQSKTGELKVSLINREGEVLYSRVLNPAV